MNLECPKCKVRFTATDATPGSLVRCTSCERRFLIAGPSPTPPSDEAFPPELIVFSAVIVLVVLGLVLAAISTPGKSVGIVFGIGLTLLTVWKRQAIDQYFKRRRKRVVAQRRAKRAAAAQAAAEAASASDASRAPANSDAPVATAASAIPIAPAAGPPNDQLPGNALNLGVPHGEPVRVALLQNEPAPATPSPPPAAPAPLVSKPAEPVPAAPVSPPPPSPEPEPDSLTAGLPEKYRVFLDAAMMQSRWPLRELEAMARLHHLNWDDVLIAINKWAQDRFGEPMLVQDDDEVWVQLPII